MVSSITLSNGTLTVDGWVNAKYSTRIQTGVDVEPMSMSSSSEAIAYDFEGRVKPITLSGWLVEGNELYSATPGTTTLAQQIQSFNSNFANSVGTEFTFKSPAEDAAGIKVTIIEWSYTYADGGPVEVAFNLFLKEVGTVI